MMQGSEVVSLCSAFARDGIRTWIAGGWAVDALLGRQTRPHQDLDLAVDARDLPSLLHLLTAHGFVTSVDGAPSRVELTAPDGRIVDLHPVTFAEDGSGTQEGREATTFHYAASGFTIGRIDGHAVPCLSAEQQLRFRQGYDLRPVDSHDIALLDDLRSQP